MPTIFCGDNFVTNDNPIGEMHNSPMVCNRYISIIQATGVKFGDIDIPNTNTRNPKPTKRSAIPNLIGPAGSNPLLAKLIHNIEKKGASIKINIAFKDWNIDAGTFQPNKFLSTPLSVKTFNDEPACSNNAQNNNENKIKNPTVRSLSRSIGSSLTRA